jgi:hypothetical protein
MGFSYGALLTNARKSYLLTIKEAEQGGQRGKQAPRISHIIVLSVQGCKELLFFDPCTGADKRGDLA